MSKFLLTIITLLTFLSITKGCVEPFENNERPDKYICKPEPNPPITPLPGATYYWLGIRVKLYFGSTWPTYCIAGIKFPRCIAKVIRTKLTWRNKYDYDDDRPITYPLSRDTESDDLMDNDPEGSYGGYSEKWRGFRGVVNPNDMRTYPDNDHGKWQLILWFLICVPARSLQCPWIIMGAGGGRRRSGDNKLEFIPGHLFKIIIPNIFSYGGDPVVNTFDGLHYEFQGLCSYILSMDCNENFVTDKKHFNKFKVIGVNKPCDLGSCLGSVIIYLKDSHGHEVRIDLLPGFEPLVNGTKVNLLNGNEYVFNGGKLSLSVGHYSSSDSSGPAVDSSLLTMFANTSQEYVRLETDSKLVFMWNGVDNLILPEEEQIKSINTCGLLGNLDGKMENDLRYPDGSIVPTLPSEAANDMEETWIVQSFVHHWVDRQPNDPANCKSAIPRVLCDGNEQKKTLSKSMCRGFIKSYKSNPKCNIQESSAEQLYNQCVHDMCFCYNNDIFACARYIYHAFEARCR